MRKPGRDNGTDEPGSVGSRSGTHLVRVNHGALPGLSRAEITDGGGQITTDTQDRGAVIVTGASPGIGAPIAELLGGDGCGIDRQLRGGRDIAVSGGL